jgi:glutamyl-tRNA synthetase
VGTAYVALFNWAWARRNGGRFILRIEDTDRARSQVAFEDEIHTALAWLGIEPDESPAEGGPNGPYRQSERKDIYRQYIDILLDKGAAYRCFCTPERLTELRTFQKAAKRPTGYDGLCRDIDPAASLERAQTESHVVRLKVDKSGTTRFKDLLRGEIVIENENVDDQVLLKSDGMPTYHMANIVDDQLMGVTIIMRAEEWIPSVPKHVMLYEALGWEPPTFAHVPLLRNADKSKISKRKNPTSLMWYRQAGYLPEALVNFLALQGWSPREDNEEFTVGEFIDKFDPADISVGGPVFDMTKLDWLNGEKIRKYTVEGLADLLMAEGFAGGWRRDELIDALPLFQDRMKSLKDFVPAALYLHERIEPDLEGLAKKTKKVDPAVLCAAMREAAKRLEDFEGFSEEQREAAIRVVAENHELKPGAVFMGLRVAITGTTASPPLFPSIARIGLAESVQRVLALVERFAPTT